MKKKSESILIPIAFGYALILSALFFGCIGISLTSMGIRSILEKSGPAWMRIAPLGFVGVLIGALFLWALIRMTIPDSRVESSPRILVLVRDLFAALVALSFVAAGIYGVYRSMVTPKLEDDVFRFGMKVLIFGGVPFLILMFVVGSFMDRKK